MSEKRWSDLDESWRLKEERAQAQREANALARELGYPAPYVNFFAINDPTKIDHHASVEKNLQSYREFRELCPPYRPKRHLI